MKKRSVLLFLFFFSYLILVPSAAISAAKEGLVLWYRSVLPSLFPSMFLCSLALKSGMLNELLPVISKPFHYLTGCSEYGCFAILSGFLCGFPMGAKISMDLHRHNKISASECKWLMGFCNNLSPAFLTAYVASGQLNHSGWSVFVLLQVLGSAFLYGILSSPDRKQISFKSVRSDVSSNGTWHKKSSASNTFAIIDDCINDTVHNVVKLGAYITLFQVITSAVKLLLPEHNILYWLILPLLEITGGIRLLVHAPFPFWMRFIMIHALCAFGGICALIQSAGLARMDRNTLLEYTKSRAIITLLSILFSGGVIVLYHLIST